MIILTHAMYLRDGDVEIPFEIRVHQPERGTQDWACRYEIDWPDHPRVFTAYGVDALQALVHALKMIASNLYSSWHHEAGLLRQLHHDHGGYGFPMVHSLRDLAVGHDAVVEGTLPLTAFLRVARPRSNRRKMRWRRSPATRTRRLKRGRR